MSGADGSYYTVLGDAMAISKTAISQDTWELVYDTINDNIDDPKIRGIQWMFAAFPDTEKWPQGTDVFPIVIIDPTYIGEERFVMGKTTKLFPLRNTIHIFSTRMDASDQLGDLVFNCIRDNEGAFQSEGLRNLKVSETPDTVLYVGGERIHEKIIIIQTEAVL